MASPDKSLQPKIGHMKNSVTKKSVNLSESTPASTIVINNKTQLVILNVWRQNMQKTVVNLDVAQPHVQRELVEFLHAQ